MNVLFASNHCCIRVIKQSIALQKAGVGVWFLHRRVANQEFVPSLPMTVGQYETPEQYREKVKNLPPWIDLIHVHNEPDWLCHLAREVQPDIPLVHDCHDLRSQQGQDADQDEVLAFMSADALIFPSKSYEAGAKTYHRAMDKPSDVIYSMCNEGVSDMAPLPRLGGIVYEGGIKVSDDPDEIGAHKDYRKLAQFLAQNGIPFSLIGVCIEHLGQYWEAGAACFTSMPYSIMLQQMTRYDWGWVGPFPDQNPQTDKYMPNKLFEYIAAGIPVMVYKADEAAEFVSNYDLGIVIEKPSDIPTVYKDHEKYRPIVQEKRGLFTMESQVPKILAVYEQAIDAAGRREG